MSMLLVEPKNFV